MRPHPSAGAPPRNPTTQSSPSSRPTPTARPDSHNFFPLHTQRLRNQAYADVGGRRAPIPRGRRPPRLAAMSLIPPHAPSDRPSSRCMAVTRHDARLTHSLGTDLQSRIPTTAILQGHPEPSNSPQSQSGRSPWRVQTPSAPQIATIPVWPLTVASWDTQRPVIRHNPSRAAYRGEFRRPAPRNSPQSPSGRSPWRVPTPSAPQIATIPARPHTVASWDTQRPANRHNPRPAAHRGELGHPAPRKSPQSPPGRTPWRAGTPSAPQIATIPARPHIVASSGAP